MKYDRFEQLQAQQSMLVMAGNALPQKDLDFCSENLRNRPILLLIASLLDRINNVTHLPCLSPVRVTHIKGRFFIALSLGRLHESRNAS